MPAMRAPRADLLPTGAIIFTQLLVSLDLPELLVSDWGLREGVLLGEPPRAYGLPESA
jgi:exopolyphosphatase/pppGpp-phosphohydrolase